MADATVIQEFLAELGFKVDQKTLGDFSKALKGGATQAVAFGNMWSDVAEGVAKGAGDMLKSVLALTQQLEDLYFASRRLGETAQNISALGYAYKQMGMAPQAAEQLMGFFAQQKVELGTAYGAAMSGKFPGAGIKATDSPEVAAMKVMTWLHREEAAGGARGQAAEQIRKQFLPMVSFEQVAQFDPEAAKKAVDESIKRQTEFGQSTDEAAKQAHGLQVEIRGVGDALHWMSVSVIGPMLAPMTQLAGSFGQLADSAAGIVKAVHGAEPGAIAGATAGVQGMLGNWGGAISTVLGGAGAPAVPHVGGQPGRPGPSGGGPRPKGVDWGAGQQLYQMLVGLGADPEMARGAVAVLGSESMGFHSGARPWSKKEHRFLSTAMGFGQWIKGRRDAYTKATGKTVGTDAASQMALLTWELQGPYANVLRGLMRHGTAAQGADIWERLFEGLHPGVLTKGRDDYAIDAAAYPKYMLASGGGMPGGGGVNQTNTFNITSTEPKAAGREVGQHLHSQNTRLARAMRGGPLT